jgi:hypothetical protein
MHLKKATPALEHPATVDGAKDKETPTLMQLMCPPEVKTQLNSTTEVTQTLLQLKDPPVFETWQHGTPDAALTLLQLKEAPEVDTLQHATASSITSQLKDDNDYNSCVEWAVAAASAGCNAEYDSDIDGNFEPLAVDGLKKPAAKATNDDSCATKIFQWDIIFNIGCTKGLTISPASIPSRCMPHELWKVYFVFLLPYHC